MFTKIMRVCASRCEARHQMLYKCVTHSRAVSSTVNQRITKRRQPIYSVEMNRVNPEMRAQFNDAFPAVVEDLMEIVNRKPSLVELFTRMFEYNVPTGKQRRGLSTILTYVLLEKEMTPEKMRIANIVAWCTELQTSAILVADDVLDGAELRRRVPCWYKLPGIGLSAIMDAYILEDSAYFLLQKYLCDHPYYMKIVELCHATYLNLCIGQLLDARLPYAHSSNLDNITWDNYKTITEYKTEYVWYLQPARVAMFLAGIGDAELHRQVEEVFRPLGYLLQVKNDFLDCFGDEKETGQKLYGDIREGKCAWPAVAAMQRVTSAQRAIMEQHFGRPDDQSVQAVMDVYRQLDMPGLFARHEGEILDKVEILTEQLDPRLPKEMVQNVLGMA